MKPKNLILKLNRSKKGLLNYVCKYFRVFRLNSRFSESLKLSLLNNRTEDGAGLIVPAFLNFKLK